MNADEFRKSRRAKNVALALALLAFVALLYVVTLVKLGAPVPS